MSVIPWIRKEIRDQRGYVPGTADCDILMDANENPYGLDDNLRGVLAERMRNIVLNRYPLPGAPGLRARFAARFGVESRCLMLGNGSDELISILCTAFAGPRPVMVIPVPTFSMYRIIGTNCGMTVAEVPLDADFDLDMPALLETIRRERPSLIFLSSPNNPTGRCFSLDRIEAVCDAAEGVVVVDEAYGVFTDKTALPLLGKKDNLVILHTLSKLGLAAIRLGFLLGPADLVRELDKVRLPYNVNVLTATAAELYLDFEPVFQEQIGRIVRDREALLAELSQLPGVRAFPSDANFIFFTCSFGADAIYGHLLEADIRIRNLSAPGLLHNGMRVTVGTPPENKAFLEAFRKALMQ